MKPIKKIVFWVPFLLLPAFCAAQSGQQVREYDYDAAGNRILRTIHLHRPPAPRSGQASLPADTFPGLESRLGTFTLKAYPNPTAGALEVEVEGEMEGGVTGSLSLHTLAGQLLNEVPFTGPRATLDLSSYPAGAYLLSVRLGGRVKEWKIIKH